MYEIVCNLINQESKKSLSSEILRFLDDNESSSVYAKGINFGIYMYVSGEEDVELSFHGKRVQWEDRKVILLNFSDATEQNINTRDGTWSNLNKTLAQFISDDLILHLKDIQMNADAFV